MRDRVARLDAVLQRWRIGGAFRGTFTATAVIPQSDAQPEDIPPWLPRPVRAGLAALGIERPWSHQVRAWTEVIAHRSDVVVATPTASGKTLCYNVPVAAALHEDPRRRALYLFPTKALARDQEAAVRNLLEVCGADAQVVVYDGDTPVDARRSARTRARVLITNPDMLHAGILPHHTKWEALFSHLHLVVIDELHHYRGVFGSHVANVLRRLQRVARFYGADPLFVCSSATIANPGELAAHMIGRKPVVIDKSGAPAGRRTFALYNPEVVDAATGLRASVYRTAAAMGADLVAEQVSTLVFCQTRKGVELTLRYLRDRLQAKGVSPEVVRGYRGGYLASLRREIEGDLRSGAIRGVVATNALELGIDVGGLDAVVLAGYPGTIAATLQRTGRAGRRGDPSLAVLVANNTPLDQFLVRRPAYLLDAPVEQALVAPDNVDILLAHLRCAAYELPLSLHERFGSVTAEELRAALELLAETGQLRRVQDSFHHVSQEYPAKDVNLRSGSGQNVVVYDVATGAPLAEVSPHSARFELHEGAIYQHDGDTYQVERFDYANAKAYVTAVKPVYYTKAIDQTTVHVLRTLAEGILDAKTAAVGFGEIEVVEHMAGFKKIRFGNHENLGYGDIDLPPLTMETEAAWLELPETVLASMDPDAVQEVVAGMAHALANAAVVRLMCDPRDIAVTSHVRSDGGRRAVYVYDAVEGGVGLARRAYELFGDLVRDAFWAVSRCECETGCPGCVGPGERDAHQVRKRGSLAVWAHLVHGVHGES